MIPAIAVIVATYAIARLLCEYVFVEDQFKPLRIILSLVAVSIIVLFLLDVISAGNDLSDLNI